MSEDNITAAIVAISGAVTAIFREVVKWAAIVAISYFIYKSIDCLAGRTTVAQIAVNFVASLKLQYTVPYAFGVGGLAYGYYQRRLRKSRIKTLSAHVTELERQIDPNRGSSNISPDGTTSGDEIL